MPYRTGAARLEALLDAVGEIANATGKLDPKKIHSVLIPRGAGGISSPGPAVVDNNLVVDVLRLSESLGITLAGKTNAARLREAVCSWLRKRAHL